MFFVRTHLVVHIYSFVVYCCKFLMYPILNLTHVLDILDTSSMGVTFGIRAGRFRSCLGSLSYNKGSGTIGFRVDVLVVVVS
jgi:hypothetical protein